MRRILAAITAAMLAGVGVFACSPSAAAQDEPVVQKRREWMEAHQSPDGSWDPQGYRLQCTGDGCDGAGTRESPVGTTGLVLLAFTGYGETHRTPRYGYCVRDGARFLMSIQDGEGCFGVRYPDRFVTDHAMALSAMAELEGMTQSPLFLDATRRGVDFLLSRRNPDGGWAAGDSSPASEIPATAWALMALRSAKTAGLEVDPEVFAAALPFLDSLTDPATGRVRRDAGAPDPVASQPAATETARFTAMAVKARLQCGIAPDEDPAVLRGLGVLMDFLPEWNEESGTVDPEYWYFGTLVTFEWGSHLALDAWKTWNAAMKTAIINQQILDRDSCRWGSWDPVGGPAAEGGRVGTTALCVLCLEVYYRYSRVFGSRDSGPRTPPPPVAPVSIRAARPSSRALNRAAALDPDFPEPRTGLLR